MRSRASSLPRPSNVLSNAKLQAKSAKESALRAAQERGMGSRTQLMDLVKAKAQSLSSQMHGHAVGAAKRARSARRSRGASRRNSGTSGNQAATDGEPIEDAAVQLISEIGVSAVAARLALRRSEGKIDAACDWLFDERNILEIEEAEIAENTHQVAKPKEAVAIDFGSGQAFLKSHEEKGGDCFMNPFSFPSPRQVPVPRRLSTGSIESSRRDADSLDGSDAGCGIARQSTLMVQQPRLNIASISNIEVEDDLDDTKPQSEHAASLGEDSWGSASEHVEAEESNRQGADAQPRQVQETQAKNDADEHDDDEQGDDDLDADEHDDDEQHEEAEEPLVTPSPPTSACWDWPLSRHERKARVALLERQMHAMDRNSLRRQLVELRVQGRKRSSEAHSGNRRLSC